MKYCCQRLYRHFACFVYRMAVKSCLITHVLALFFFSSLSFPFFFLSWPFVPLFSWAPLIFRPCSHRVWVSGIYAGLCYTALELVSPRPLWQILQTCSPFNQPHITNTKFVSATEFDCPWHGHGPSSFCDPITKLWGVPITVTYLWIRLWWRTENVGVGSRGGKCRSKLAIW